MANYDAMFWTEQEKYHDFAKRFESGITLTHPPDGASCWCGEHCPFKRTAVKRYEYRGPRVTHL